MPWRIFHYVALLKLAYYQHYQEDIIVLPIVIWATKGKPPAPSYVSGLTTDVGITCTYRHLRLHDFDWQGVDPVLLVLAPFLHGMSRSHLKEAGLRLYAAAPPEYRILLLAAFFSISQRMYKDIAEIEQEILDQVRVCYDGSTQEVS
jgi:hypothetical protein